MADRSQLCKSSKYPHELHGLHDELIQTPVVLNYVLTYTRQVRFICVFFFWKISFLLENWRKEYMLLCNLDRHVNI